MHVFFIFGLFIVLPSGLYSAPIQEEIQISDKYSQYNCHKHEVCKNGGPKICAFDEERSELAVFEDLCTMYKANCYKAGMFVKVEMEVCDVKKKYQAEYGDDFDWQPIPRITISDAVV